MQTSERSLVVIFLSALVLVACGGREEVREEPPSLVGVNTGAELTTCRRQVDCTGGTLCNAPLPPPFCGVFAERCAGGLPLGPDCGVDADCAQRGEGFVCQPYPGMHDYGATGHDSVPNAWCMPACDPTSDSHPDALPDTRCAEDGHYRPLRCTDGDYECPAHDQCVPDGGDEHGCGWRPCEQDTQCPSEMYCVLGRCQPSLGWCLEADTRP